MDESDKDITPAPLESPLTTYKWYRHKKKPQLNPPSTPPRHPASPSQHHRSEFVHHSTEAEVHLPPNNVSPGYQRSTHLNHPQPITPPRHSRTQSRPQHPPQQPQHSTTGNNQGTLPKLFSMVMKAIQLHQEGSTFLEIFSNIWPILSELLSPIFQ